MLIVVFVLQVVFLHLFSVFFFVLCDTIRYVVRYVYFNVRLKTKTRSDKR